MLASFPLHNNCQSKSNHQMSKNCCYSFFSFSSLSLLFFHFFFLMPQVQQWEFLQADSLIGFCKPWRIFFFLRNYGLFQAQLGYFVSLPQMFTKEPWLNLVENDIQCSIYALGVLFATEVYLLPLGPNSEQSSYAHIHIYIHTLNQEFILTLPIQI